MGGLILDREDGVTRTYHEEDGRIYIKQEADISAVLEENKRLKNEVSGPMGDMVHIGHIPMIILDKWRQEDGINYLAPENSKALLRKLHHPDNGLFKTHPGRFV